MNEKTTKQIEEMMNQTIGVEVEMNNITRTKAAQLCRRVLRNKARNTSTHRPQRVTIPTPHGTARVESGSFRRT